MNQLDVTNGAHLVTKTRLQNSTFSTSTWIKNQVTTPEPVYLVEIEIRQTGCVAASSIWHTPDELDALIANLQAHREHIKAVQTELIAMQTRRSEQAKKLLSLQTAPQAQAA